MDLLTPEQVATTCHVTTQTVLNWIQAGKLDAVRLSPRVIRIPREGFERFLLADDRLPARHVLRGAPSPSARNATLDSSRSFFAPSPSLEDLAREQGVGPTVSLNDLRGDVWPPGEDGDAFLATIREARRSRPV
jgi:excisionase family DNA binding protein